MTQLETEEEVNCESADMPDFSIDPLEMKPFHRR
jgi:hypothetical protein